MARRPNVEGSKFFWEKNLKPSTLGHHHSGRFDQGFSPGRLLGAARQALQEADRCCESQKQAKSEKSFGAPPERRGFQIFLGKKFETLNAGASPFERWLSIRGLSPERSLGAARQALQETDRSRQSQSRSAQAFAFWATSGRCEACFAPAKKCSGEVPEREPTRER